MRKVYFCIALIIVSNVLFLSGCQTGQTKVAAAPEVLAEFKINEDYIKNGILLPVKFQGEEYLFALDTGAAESFFDDSFKDKLGKRIHLPLHATGAYGKRIKYESYSFFTNEPEFSLGSLSLVDSGLNLCNLDQFRAEDDRKYQGIIGMDFLKKYIVQIDFSNEKVMIFKGKKDNDLFSAFKSKENKHLEWGEPITLKKPLFSNLRFIEGSFSGEINEDFLIDTGWNFPGVLKWKLFDKINSRLSDPNNNNPLMASVQTDKRGMVLLTDNFSIGSKQYKEMLFQKSNISILGLPFLSKYLVTFDFPNNVMYLKENKNPGKQQQMLIVLAQTGCIINASSHEVFKVEPNSPAYAKGVRKKDILVKVNDTDISTLNLVEFMNLSSRFFDNEHGECIFTFKRGEEILTVTFNW